MGDHHTQSGILLSIQYLATSPHGPAIFVLLLERNLLMQASKCPAVDLILLFTLQKFYLPLYGPL